MPQIFVRPYIPAQEPDPELPYYLPANFDYNLPTQYASLTPPNQVFAQDQPNINVLPAEQEYWTNQEKAGIKNVYETLAKPVKKLLGVGGEERYQTWPERTIRSALALPAEVYKGEVLSGPGLRREDYTDIPGQIQPLDPMIERAQDVAGLAGGTMFTGVKPGVASLGAGPVRQIPKEMEAFRISKPEISDYVYHRTGNKKDINKIIEEGLVPKNHESNYFWYGDKAENLAELYTKNWAEKQSEGDILRINKKYLSSDTFKNSSNVLSTPDVIPPNAIEVKTKDGWKSLTLLSETSKVGAPLSALEKAPTPELKKQIGEKGFPLFTGGLEFPKPLEQPTFDERWRDRVPEEFIQNDEIKNFLDKDKIREYPTNIQSPGRFNDKRSIRLTKIDYDPFR